MRLWKAKWRTRTGLGVLAAGLALCMALPALTQEGLINAPEPAIAPQVQRLAGRLANKPSQPPAFKISVGPLGFTAPGAFYLGLRNSFVSLDFFDESRLLFTFRVPGLIRREAGEEDERQIRAVVLALPAGTIEAEALWRVHGRTRYLWMLHDGHFLLRDGNNLEVGDATLELKPFLRFPGPLLWLEMDPTQQFLAAASQETTTPSHKPAESDIVMRILRRDSGKVLLVSRTGNIARLPINADGYLEGLRARSGEWLMNMSYFSGGSAVLGQLDSTCSPFFDFLSQREVLVTTCTPLGGGKLVAMTTEGRRLWEAETPETTIWPLVVRAPDGSRLAWETLTVTHPVNARSPLSQDEINGQLVEVLDAADGKVALETVASPVLDAGGNVAISPSGRRVAVLNGGAIQVFELPPAPAQPAAPPPER